MPTFMTFVSPSRPNGALHQVVSMQLILLRAVEVMMLVAIAHIAFAGM